MNMPPTSSRTQRRHARLSMALTPLEREAVDAVAEARGVAVGNLLRDLSLQEVLDRYDALRADPQPEPAKVA